MPKKHSQRPLSFLCCKQLLQQSRLRVSKGAIEEFMDYAEDKLSAVAARAVSIAKHSGRRTVLESDVRFVLAELEDAN